MKSSGLVVTVLSLVVAMVPSFVAPPASAQGSCLDPTALIELDGEWERALLESDAELLGRLLADDFVWVHNHASGVDTKAALIERVSNASSSAAGATRSRVSSDVETRILGSTGVVTGFTVVDRGPGSTRYNFMRTYVEVGGRCVLLANHTMEVPEDVSS